MQYETCQNFVQRNWSKIHNIIVLKKNQPKLYAKLDWNESELSHGRVIQLEFMPSELPLRLFKISVSKNKTDYVF